MSGTLRRVHPAGVSSPPRADSDRTLVCEVESSRLEKSYLELNNASHVFPQSANTETAVLFVSWLKRFVDDDTRCDQFICPGPSRGLAIEEYRGTRPLG